jgi:hypothetical protein
LEVKINKRRTWFFLMFGGCERIHTHYPDHLSLACRTFLRPPLQRAFHDFFISTLIIGWW